MGMGCLAMLGPYLGLGGVAERVGQGLGGVWVWGVAIPGFRQPATGHRQRHAPARNVFTKQLAAAAASSIRGGHPFRQRLWV